MHHRLFAPDGARRHRLPHHRRIIAAAARKLAARGIVTLIAGLDPTKRENSAFASLGLEAISHQHWFADLERAMEWTEAELLREHSPTVAADVPVDISETDIARGLSPGGLALLRSHLKPTEAQAGTVLFRGGAAGDSMFVIERGLVEIRVASDAGTGTTRRLAVIDPGSVFGEIAMLASGERSADAVCVKATRLHELRREALTELAQQAPVAYSRILANLNRHLAIRLIAATELATGMG